MLTDLVFLSLFQYPNCLNSPETHVQSSWKRTFYEKFNISAILFSGHLRSGIKFGDWKFDGKTLLLINYLNLNNTGWRARHNNITVVIHVSCKITQIIENSFSA